MDCYYHEFRETTTSCSITCPHEGAELQLCAGPPAMPWRPRPAAPSAPAAQRRSACDESTSGRPHGFHPTSASSKGLKYQNVGYLWFLHACGL